MTYFSVIEHPLDLTKWTVSVTDDLCKQVGTLVGSYRVFCARVLGLSYPDYIVWVLKKWQGKVCFPAFLSGPMFNDKANANELAQLLNKNFTQLVKESANET